MVDEGAEVLAPVRVGGDVVICSVQYVGGDCRQSGDFLTAPERKLVETTVIVAIDEQYRRAAGR